MRRRDTIALCVVCGGLLAGLVWALSTQARWVRENQPIQVPRPALGQEDPAPAPPDTTGVIGTVSDDTRASLAREQAARKAPRQASPPGAGAGAGSGPGAKRSTAK